MLGANSSPSAAFTVIVSVPTFTPLIVIFLVVSFTSCTVATFALPGVAVTSPSPLYVYVTSNVSPAVIVTFVTSIVDICFKYAVLYVVPSIEAVP